MDGSIQRITNLVWSIKSKLGNNMSRLKDLEICLSIVTKQVYDLQREIENIKRLIDKLLEKESNNDRN